MNEYHKAGKVAGPKMAMLNLKTNELAESRDKLAKAQDFIEARAEYENCVA